MLPKPQFWKNAIITSILGCFHIISLFTMSSSPLILITGANGFVGYAVLAGALKAKVSDDKDPYDGLLHGHASYEKLIKNCLLIYH